MTDHRDTVKKEVDDLPPQQAEQVLHHERQLKGTAAAVPGKAANSPGSAVTPDTGRSLEWKCGRCNAVFTRSEEAPGVCPECGASREEITLREAPEILPEG